MENIKVFDVIKYPLTTVKAGNLNKNNKLVLKVSIDSTKIDIKFAVKNLFGVTVTEVKTMIIKGKRKMFGKKHEYFSKDYKKAIVTLKKGDSIKGLSESPEQEVLDRLEQQKNGE